MGRSQARWVLAVLGLGTLAAVAISLSAYRIAFYDRPEAPSDLELYWAEVTRIQQGQGYYEAASIELRERGYPTHSVFNWRTPLPVWLLGRLPSPDWGHWFLRLSAIALLVLGVVVMRTESSFWESAAVGIFLAGAVMPCLVGKLYVEPLLWSGVFIPLSMIAYHFGARWPAIVLGTLAVFFRDFAGLYVVVMFAMALKNRRFAEALAWACGLAAFAVFFVVHAYQVSQYSGEGDLADVARWLTFNGLPAIIGMTQMNGFLLLLPQWVSAIFLTLSILGFIGWTSQLGYQMGATVAGYLVVFSIIGRDVNQFWGTLFAPMLCFGAARGIGAIRDLVAAAK